MNKVATFIIENCSGVVSTDGALAYKALPTQFWTGYGWSSEYPDALIMVGIKAAKAAYKKAVANNPGAVVVNTEDDEAVWPLS